MCSINYWCCCWQFQAHCQFLVRSLFSVLGFCSTFWSALLFHCMICSLMSILLHIILISICRHRLPRATSRILSVRAQDYAEFHGFWLRSVRYSSPFPPHLRVSLCCYYDDFSSITLFRFDILSTYLSISWHRFLIPLHLVLSISSHLQVLPSLVAIIFCGKGL